MYAICPDQDCNMIVPQSIFKKLLEEEAYSRYLRFLIKSYVGLSINAKECPGKNCNYIIANKTNSNIGVECPCGT